jgi:uncharacterized damage-inducible protein DinB
MTSPADLLQELEQEALATRRVLERVPESHLDWRPHERSLTLGQLAMHVASIPGAIAELSMQPRFDARTPIPRPGASGVMELVSTLDRSVDRARELLGGMADSALATPWRATDGERELFVLPRGALLRSVLLNHWYHHRGQLTVYLRMTGVPVPAIYGPSADEIPQ